MGKRKMNVQPKPVEDAPQPKMMSDERFKNLKQWSEPLRFKAVDEMLMEIDRLRDLGAAKDAEIARLVKMERERWESAAKMFELRCRNCDGTGSIALDITGQRGIKCPSCNGSGIGFDDK